MTSDAGERRSPAWDRPGKPELIAVEDGGSGHAGEIIGVVLLVVDHVTTVEE